MKSFIRTILNTKRIPTIAVVISMLSYVLVPNAMVFAEVMHSTQYRLESDSLNFGGNRSSSASYITEDTIGEVGSGNSNSTSYKNRAGYQQADVIAVQSDTHSSSASGAGSYGSVVNVVEFFAVPLEKSISLNWSYPVVSNIESVKIVRSDKFYPTSMTDGETIFEGSSIGAIDYDVVPGVTYYYALFAKNINGEYSSGVLAQARIPVIGEEPSNISKDPFENVPNAQNVDKIIRELTLADFDFIQDGKLIEHADKTIPIHGGKDLTISLAYDKVPEILKTIAVSLFDPEDDTKVFTFLLRVNKDKTAYTATIGPLLKSGDYKLNIIILDYKNQGLKRLNGDLRAVVFEGAKILSYFNNISINILILSISFILLLILILAAILKKKKTALASLMLLIALGTGIYFSVAKAAINKEINYQGKLFDSAGDPVSDGYYNMRFKLYTSADGATPIWSETWCKSPDSGSTCDGTGTNSRVSVTDGLFSVMLGSISTLNSVDFNQQLYLGVDIGTDNTTPTWDGEMTPRKKIGAVPAAFEADKLDGISSEQFLRSDTQNATTSSATFLNVLQSGAGKVAEFFGQGSASVLSILSDGKVGIGTTTPTDTLSVNGPIYLADTTPTATGNRLYANGGDLYYAGNLIGGATTGNWTSNGTDVWRPTGNVGVGTTSPAKKLQVYVTTSGDGIGIDGTTNPAFNLRINGVTKGNFAAETTGNAWFTGAALNDIALTASSGNLALVTGTTARLYVSAAGNVGIGTTSPYAKLSVTSTSVASTTLALRPVSSQTANIVDIFNGSGSLVSVINTSGFMGIGSTSPTGMLTITNTGTTYPSFVVEDSASPDASPFLIDNAGLVGIGTSTPDTPLTIYSGTAVDKDAISAHGFNGSTAEKTMIRLMNGNRGYNWGIRFGAARDSFGGGNSGDAFVVNTKTQNGAEVERFRISKDGYVSIGSTTPFSAALSVYNNLPSKNVLLLDALSGTTVPILDVKLASTSKFVVDASGNVGIGTSSPYGRLSVLAGDTEKIVFSHNSGEQILTINNGSMELIRSGNTSFNIGSIDAFTPSLKFLGTANATKWTIEREAASNPYLRFNSNSANNVLVLGNSGNVGIGSTSPYAQLAVGGRSTGTTLFALDALSGQTAPILDVKLASTSKFMVDGSGNVGIGTSTPQHALHVLSSSDNQAILDATSGSRYTTLDFRNAYSLKGQIFWDNTGGNFNIAASNSGKLNLNPSGGNVGIGTSSPTTQLHVSGTAPDIRQQVTSGSNFYSLTSDLNFSASDAWNLTFDTVSGASDSIIQYDSPDISKILTLGVNGGSTVLRGNIGIATSSPYAQLSVGGNSTSNTLFALDALSGQTRPIVDIKLASTSKFVIDSSGNVGVGTTNPYAGLSVWGANTTSGSRNFELVNSASTTLVYVDNAGNVNIPVTTATTTIGGGLSVAGATGLTVLQNGFIQIGTSTTIANADITIQGHGSSVPYFALTNGASSPSAYFGRASAIITGGGATDFGFQATTNNSILFATNGSTERMRISSSGNVGIGTTSPYASLAITNTGTNPSFVVEDSTSPDTTPFIIDASGNVGIGTTTPGQKLEVMGIGRFDGTNTFSIGSDTNYNRIDTAGSGSEIFRFLSTGNNMAGIRAGSMVIGTAAPFLTATAPTQGLIVQGNVGIGTTSPLARLDVAGANNGTSPLFQVSSVSSFATTTRFIVDSSGNVGIGTTSPDRLLTVSGATSATTTIETRTANTTPGLEFRSNVTGNNVNIGNISFNNSNGNSTLANIVGFQGSSAVQGALIFSTRNSTGFAERMRIDTTGNMGIGTTSPMGTLSIGSGQFILQNGSATTPSTGFADEATSGIYRPSAGVFGIAINGAGRLGVNASNSVFIPSTGSYGISSGAGITTADTNISRFSAGVLAVGTGSQGSTAGTLLAASIGVGSTSPYASLSITNTGTSPSFVVEDSTSPDGSPFIIDASGNVGIGGSAPGTLGKVEITDTGSTAYGMYLSKSVSNAATYSSAFNSVFTSNQTSAAFGGMNAGIYGQSFIGGSNTQNWNGTGGNESTSGAVAIVGHVEGRSGWAGTVTNASSFLASNESSATGGGVITNLAGFRMLDAAGTGTITNQYGLYINSLTRGSTSNYGVYQAGTSNLNYFGGSVGIGSTSPYASLAITNTGTSPSFVVEDSTSPDTSAFIIDNNGDTAIGTTTSATYKLQVQGSTNVIGTARFHSASTDSSAPTGQTSTNRGIAIDAGIFNTDSIIKAFQNSGAALKLQTQSTGDALIKSEISLAANTNVIKFGTAHANSGENATERMRIDHNGNIGIGTSSPYAVLTVANTATTTANTPLLVVASTTNGTATSTFLTVQADGKVGIGTANPTYKLEIAGGTSLSSLLNLSYKGTGSTDRNVISLSASETSGPTENGVLTIRSNATDVISFTAVPNATSYVSGNFGVGTTTGWGLLSVNPNGITGPSFVIGSSTATNFVVTNGGLVGIGTAGPGTTLDVRSSGTSVANFSYAHSGTAITNINGINLANTNATTNNWVGFLLGDSAGGQASALFGAQLTDRTNHYGDMAFGTRGTDGFLERLRITSTGNVGIGTTSPYATLSVVGNVVATNFTATSTSATSTFAGGVDFGSGNFSYDTYSGVTSINSLQTGNLNFDTDAGLVSWTDMALSSTPNGAPVGYTAFLNGSSTISVYGVSAGNGWLQDDYPRVAIGSTTAPSSKLTVFGNGTANGGIFELVNSASTTLMKALDNGNIGIASTSPWKKFSVNGTVALSGLTSSATGNALCITASKEVTDSGGASCTPSSIRFKENVLPLDPGYALGQIAKLSVVNFDYKEKQQFETNHSYGMIAEDVELVDKNLVDYGYDGKPVSLHFEKITGLLVQAVQEQQGQIGNLGSTTSRLDLTTNQLVASSTLGMTNMDIRLNNMDSVIASLSASTTLISAIASTTVDLIASSTANSILESKSFVERVFITFIDSLEDTVAKIKSIFVGDLHIENKLCVDDVCVNKEQLKALLIQATASSTPNSNVNTSENNNSNQNNNVEENSNSNNNPVEENNNQGTTTPPVNPPSNDNASSTPSTSNDASSENPSTPAETPAPEPTPEVTPPPAEAPVPEPEPSPEPAPEPAPEASPAPQA